MPINDPANDAALAERDLIDLRTAGADISEIATLPDGTFAIATPGNGRLCFGPDTDGGWDWADYDSDGSVIAQDYADTATMAEILKDRA